jgi:hypothetical protein
MGKRNKKTEPTDQKTYLRSDEEERRTSREEEEEERRTSREEEEDRRTSREEEEEMRKSREEEVKQTIETVRLRGRNAQEKGRTPYGQWGGIVIRPRIERTEAESTARRAH